MSTDWRDTPNLAPMLDADARRLIAHLSTGKAPKGHVLFRPGDSVQGFAILISGHIGVYLSGPHGRDIQLYTIEPGQTCVQSTLGILGAENYSAEAICESDVEFVVIPKALFSQLLAESAAFRSFVFGAFSARMQSIMHLLEQVAFVRVESRLAAQLIELAGDTTTIHVTHQELATKIGTAREVVSRQLEALEKIGVVTLERGVVRILDIDGLTRRSAA